jgi:hypothetical protein
MHFTWRGGGGRHAVVERLSGVWTQTCVSSPYLKGNASRAPGFALYPGICLTYLLHETVFPQKPKRPKLLKKFPAFYATRRFISAFKNVPYNWGKSTEKSQSSVHHLKHTPTLSLNVSVTRSHLNIRGAHKTWQHRTKALARPDTNNVELLQEYLRVDRRVCFAETNNSKNVISKIGGQGKYFRQPHPHITLMACLLGHISGTA